MARRLIRIELAFASQEEPDALGDRIHEAVSQIVSPDHVEEFRVRTIPLDPRDRGHLRPVE